VWLRAVWLVSSQKRGLSLLDLRRLLGLGSYETAWRMLHKLRRAMRPTSGLLYGVVEIDETYVGGPGARARGRRQANEAIVAIAVEKHEPKGLGRARLERIVDVSADTLTGFVQRHVAPSFPDENDRLCETILETDGWPGDDRLAAAGYRHEQISLNQTRDRKAAHRELPACHRVAALLKRWLLGTHQGGVNREQLDAYLDEFVFRFNRRSSRSIGLRFTACSQARCRPRRARTRPSSPHRLPDPTPSIEVRQGDSPLQANPRDRIYEPYAFATRAAGVLTCSPPVLTG